MALRSPTLMRGPYKPLAQDITPAGASGVDMITYTTDGINMRTVFKLASAPVTMADGTSHLSYGSLLLGTFPTGLISQFGMVFDLTALRSVGAATGLNTGAALVIGLGSTAQTNAATITSTAATFLASSATTLTAFQAAAANLNRVPSTAFVGTSTTATTLYFNAAAAATETTTTGADTLTVSGVIVLDWKLSGMTGQ